jgi:hypothetical protein
MVHFYDVSVACKSDFCFLSSIRLLQFSNMNMWHLVSNQYRVQSVYTDWATESFRKLPHGNHRVSGLSNKITLLVNRWTLLLQILNDLYAPDFCVCVHTSELSELLSYWLWFVVVI